MTVSLIRVDADSIGKTEQALAGRQGEDADLFDEIVAVGEDAAHNE